MVKRCIIKLVVVIGLPLLIVAGLAANQFTLYSSAFRNGGEIPARYTSCSKQNNALNMSPPLSWSGAPADTQSFAVIMSDLDIPVTSMIVITGKDGKPYSPKRKVGYHWVLVNIPASVDHLPADINHYSPIGLTGTNLFHRQNYMGPCPPVNDSIPHHYVVSVYALNVSHLNLPANGSFVAEQAMHAMQGHVLAEATYSGYYQQ